MGGGRRGSHPRAACGAVQGSGGQPGLDLQGQLVQGVLVDDEALVQQVVSDLLLVLDAVGGLLELADFPDDV